MKREGATPAVGPDARRDPVVLALIALGLGLRVLRWLDDRSLWNDEAQLALGVMSRGGLALLEPLAHGQAAAPGFLLLVRLCIAGLGAGEASLRLVPLLAGLASVPLFAWIARRVLAARASRLAVGLFALAEPLVYYAAELKPYSLDVAVVLLLTAVALRHAVPMAGRHGGTGHAGADLGWLAGAGVVAPWLSYPAVFALAAIGSGLWASRPRAERIGLLAVGACWAASFALLWWLHLAGARADPYLQAFWRDAYAPMPPASLEDLGWYARSLRGFAIDPVGIVAWWAALPLAALGASVRLRGRGPLRWWLLGPLAFGLMASMLELYPLRTWAPVDPWAGVPPYAGRLWLFAVPAVMIAVAQGAEILVARLREHPRWLRPALNAVLVAVVAGPALVRALHGVVEPPRVQELRPLARQLGEEVRPGDSVWVLRGSEPTFEYYARSLGLRVRAHNVGFDGPARVAALERDLAALAPGDRVWLVGLDHPAWTTGAEWDRVVAALEARAEPHRQWVGTRARVLGYVVPGRAGRAQRPGAGAGSAAPADTRASSRSPTR